MPLRMSEAVAVVTLAVALSALPSAALGPDRAASARDHAGSPAALAAPPTGRAVLPVDGAVLRVFAPPATPFGAGHRGVDLTAPAGTPVRAALPGTVSFSGQVAGRGWVTIDHGGGLATTYGWLDPRDVAAGDQVEGAQRIGRIAAAASHLDWGARLHGSYLDPLGLLGRWRARLVAARPSAHRP